MRNPLNPRGPYKRKSVLDRLLCRCVRDDTTNCLNWTGATAGQMGYGVMGDGDKQKYTHRISYELCFGSIPKGLIVLHSCDNPLCCEPTHLSIGTHKENTQDAVKKNRMAYGERSGMSKLTADQVKDIREKLLLNETKASIAKTYGVARATIIRIAKGECWKPR